MSERAKRSPQSANTDGWAASGSFLGSILAGTLLGYFADRWLGTEPWLVVVGIIAGSYSGFMTLYRRSEPLEEVKRERP
jgi:F0F1-type ATP synthase assembly protein I